MMSLSEYLNEVGDSNLDYGDHSEITKRLTEYRSSFKDRDNGDIEKKTAQLEYEVFMINLSVQKGIEPVTEGTRREGDQDIRVIWPDISTYTEEDFKYISQRYQETANLYAKSTYGLILFLVNKKADNDFVLELVGILRTLAEAYLVKAISKNKHYVLYFSRAFQNAFYLSQRRMQQLAIGAEYQEMTKRIFEVLRDHSYDEKEGEFINTLGTKLLSENHKGLDPSVDLNEVYEINWILANRVRSANGHRCIDMAENNLKLAVLLKKDVSAWYNLIADTYVDLAKAREEVSGEFYIRAIRNYKHAKNNVKATATHLLLEEAKKKIPFGRYEYVLPEEDTKKLNEEIVNEITTGDTTFVVYQLAQGVYLPKFSSVKNDQRNGEFTTARIIPIAHHDKFGNKVAMTGPQTDDDDTSFYSAFDMEFQVRSQMYTKYFIEAIKGKKLSFDILKAWIQEHTWYSEKILRVYSGYSAEITIWEMLEEPCELLFTEISRALESGHKAKYVCALDSLTLKAEYILRIFLSEKVGIPSSYVDTKGLVEEKTFTHMMSDLRNFVINHQGMSPEMKRVFLDDFVFFDFVLNNKAGKNIRNRVAHGLLDHNEFSLLKIALVMAVILKFALFRTSTTGATVTEAANETAS